MPSSPDKKRENQYFSPSTPPPSLFDCMRPPWNDPSIKLFSPFTEILLHNETYALLFFTSCLSAFVFNPISLIWQSTYFFMAYLRWNNLKKKNICFHVLWMKWFFRRRIQALLSDEIIFTTWRRLIILPRSGNSDAGCHLLYLWENITSTIHISSFRHIFSMPDRFKKSNGRPVCWMTGKLH